MLRPNVMWKLKEPVEGATRAENAQMLKTKLESCGGIVKGQGLFEVGPVQPGFHCIYDVVFVSEFDDAAALAAYQMPTASGARGLRRPDSRRQAVL